MTTLTAPDIGSLTLKIEQETRVKASLAVTFAALLEELGPAGTRPDGTSMDMKIEPVPAVAGTATWATAMATTGPPCNPSSAPRCLSCAGHSLCRSLSRTTSSTGSARMAMRR